MTDPHSLAAFSTTEFIRHGQFDKHLDQIIGAAKVRRAVLAGERPPDIRLPEGQVWVWMNDPVNAWEPRGTGVVI